MSDVVPPSGAGLPVPDSRSRARRIIVSLGLWLICLAITLPVQSIFSGQDRFIKADLIDTNFIVYRFATNLSSGNWLVYRTPNAAISTYPFAPVLLSLISRLVGDYGSTGAMIFTLATATGAVFLSF